MNSSAIRIEKSLIAIIPIFMLGIATAQPAQCATGIVSWWAGDGDALDLEDGNHGVLHNGAAYAPGFLGQAFSFDGADDHIRVADAPNLDATNALSVEAWLYPTGITTSYPTILGKWDAVGVNHRSYVMHLDSSGRVYFRVSPNGLELGFGVGTVISNATAPLNQWTHIVGVYDGSAVKIYINGTLDNQVAYNQGIVAGTNDLSIGGIVGGVGAGQSVAPFAGLIDEVKLFDCGLPASAVANAFSSGATGSCQLNVAVDIKPGSYPNSINLCSNGAVPVAILGSLDLDVLEINVDTLRFAEAEVKVVGKKDPHTLCSVEDVNGDAYDDLVCHFLTTNIAALGGESTTATVRGELFAGTLIGGVDSVSIVMDECQ